VADGARRARHGGGATPLFSNAPECGTIWGVVPGPLMRASRAALFAVVCVGVGAALHAAAYGCHVTALGVALGLLGACALGYAGLGRERNGPTLTAGLGAAQLGLHYLLTATSAMTPGAAAMRPMPSMPDAMAMPAPGPHLSTTAMLLAHALAVAASGWWLRCGEREFFALCRAAAVVAAEPLRRLLVAATLLATGTGTPAAAPRKSPARRTPAPRRPGLPLLTTLTFRGPPVAV